MSEWEGARLIAVAVAVAIRKNDGGADGEKIIDLKETRIEKAQKARGPRGRCQGRQTDKS